MGRIKVRSVLRGFPPYREYKTPASYKCDAPGNAIYVTSLSSPQPTTIPLTIFQLFRTEDSIRHSNSRLKYF
jgi:hypothetical protein